MILDITPAELVALRMALRQCVVTVQTGDKLPLALVSLNNKVLDLYERHAGVPIERKEDE